MKITPILALTAISGGLTLLSAAPTIATLGIKNSASYANPSFQTGAIAQGSLFVVFGSGLGPAQIQYAASFPLPTTLNGTSASVTVAGATLPCIMIYTQDAQIAAILPSATPVGIGTLTVTYNNATSSTAPISVAANSPGLFTRSQQGSGPGVIQDVNGNYNSFTNSFQPGQTITFWGTGLGPISGSDSGPPPTGNLPGANVTALIGNQPATVTYAGRSSYAGVDQINITIPSGVSGCFVSVGIFDNGVPSNFTSISVSTNTAVCSDPNLFTSADIQRVASGNSIRLGTSVLTQVTASHSVLGLTLSVDEELGSADFREYTAANFLNSQTQLSDLAVSPGSCGVFEQVNGVYNDLVPAQALNSGTAINLNTGGTSMSMPSSAVGHYQASFSNENPLSPSPPFLKPAGVVAVDNGGGGADVSGFTFNATLPPAIKWTNKPSAGTISRTQNLSINWSGGDPTSFVYVLGQSPLDGNGTAAEFICVAPNSAGGLTVPAAILSALPPSVNVTEQGVSIPGGLLVVNATTISRATASGLDIFLVGTSSGDGKAGFAFQ